MRGAASLLTLRTAIENASSEPVSDEAIVGMLRGGPASGSQLRAVFGDVSLQGLARAGLAHGVPLRTILEAYERARRTAAAANPELDAALRPGW